MSRMAMALAACVVASVAWANGGPFVVKYPEGDPAAKGVLARIGPDLKPARETRLRVVEEDLTITFGRDRNYGGEDARKMPPLAFVRAAYTIENPTAEQVEVDFGFPILRGIYMSPNEMMPTPEVEVTLGEEHLEAQIISNSAVYGIIRQSARRAIDRALAKDPRLAGLTDDVRTAKAGAREALGSYLTGTLKWNERDAALMVEYASLELDQTSLYPRDRSWIWTRDEELRKLVEGNLGPLAAIGEQKATQLFAQLAARFEPETAAAYEAIFAAWGGDVRERSVDLLTGELRPREVTVDPTDRETLDFAAMVDPTIYARVDYLDENAQITEAEKASCKNILRNLPVIFTFAPMNLIHYTAKFTPAATQQLTVSYAQHAYRDTHEPASYQLAYVVHPASMWEQFGPISLEVAVPEGVDLRASVACAKGASEEREPPAVHHAGRSEDKVRYDLYRGTVEEKTGELFVALDAETWHNQTASSEETAQRPPTQQAQQRQP